MRAERRVVDLVAQDFRAQQVIAIGSTSAPRFLGTASHNRDRNGRDDDYDNCSDDYVHMRRDPLLLTQPTLNRSLATDGCWPT